MITSLFVNVLLNDNKWLTYYLMLFFLHLQMLWKNSLISHFKNFKNYSC